MLIASAVTFCACTKKKKAQEKQLATEVIVLSDITDPLLVKPDHRYILNLLRLEDNKDDASLIVLRLISDRVLNPSAELYLPSRAVSEKHNKRRDRKHRDTYILGYDKHVQKAFAEFQNRFKPDGYINKSECFCTITSSLRELKQSKAQKKILVIYSDLFENGDFSVYHPDVNRLIQDNPGKAAELLAKRCPVPWSLKGITIYVIYQPKDREDDRRFLNIASVYQLLLENTGAQLYIRTNNTMHTKEYLYEK